jgi:hypothetical protein
VVIATLLPAEALAVMVSLVAEVMRWPRRCARLRRRSRRSMRLRLRARLPEYSRLAPVIAMLPTPVGIVRHAKIERTQMFWRAPPTNGCNSHRGDGSNFQNVPRFHESFLSA